MAKKPYQDNEENFKKYQARIREHLAQGIVPPDHELTIDELAAEGEKLLLQEAKSGKKTSSPTVVDKQKLEATLGASSKNPYIRARIKILESYSEWQRKEIGQMEQAGKTDNRHYAEFCRAVVELGDALSDEKQNNNKK